MRVDLRFCGREGELAELERRWQLASDGTKPRAQLALLTAERGLGKTRLVAEFYRRLAQKARTGAEGEAPYWPAGDTLLGRQIALNPPLAQCDLSQPAPFLWWGIAAQEGGADALAISDRHLVPHLVALSLKAKLLATGRTLAKLWLDVGVDFVVGLTGFDTIVSVGKGALETARIVSDSGPTVSTLAAEHAAQQAARSRVDAIIADLEQVLNPAARLTFAKVPAVIVIDDAQFAAKDPALTRLFERLLFQAQRDNWPLMIIVTHWAREFALDWKEGGRSIAGIIRHATSGSTGEPGPAAGLAGGFLSEEHYGRIELSNVADLGAAVTDRLPGLTAEQVAMLVDKTDGNGRFLEQVLAFAEANPRLFVDFDPAQAFNEAGAAEVEAKSTNILEVISERLNDELVAPEVRHSLALASYQGIRAVREIVNEVGEELLGQPLGDPLLMGDDPHSLLVFDEGQSVATFAERLFLQAANELRRNTRGLHDDRVLSETLCRTLMQHLLAKFADMAGNASALEAMSLIAGDHYASAESEEAQELVLASLAIRLALSRGQANPDAVRELAVQFFDRFGADPNLARRVPHKALLACADAAFWLDRMEDATALVGWRVRLNHEQSGGQVDASSAPAIADWLERNLILQGLQGEDQQAAMSLNAAMSLRHATMQATGSWESIDAYARTAQKLAQMQEMHGQAEAAIDTVTAMTALYRKPQEVAEDEGHRLAGLGWTVDLLASMAAKAQRYDVARNAHGESLAITRDLAGRSGDPQIRRNLSASLNKASQSELGYADEERLVMLEESVAIMRTLCVETPSLEHARDLAVALTCRSRCQSAGGASAAALSDMAEAAAILEDVANRLPTLRSGDDVMASLGNLRRALVAQGMVDRARAVASRMVEVGDRQGEVDPSDKAPWKARLTQARTERELGDERSYAQRLAEAQVAAMKRYEKGPVSTEIAIEIATICHLSGEYRAAQEDWTFAHMSFATGRNILFPHASEGAPDTLWQVLFATACSAVSTLGTDTSTAPANEIKASFAIGVRLAKSDRLNEARQLAQAAMQSAATLGIEDGTGDLNSLLDYLEKARLP